MSFQLDTGVVAQAIGGEMVLLDTRSGRYYDLNASGTLMLEALLRSQSLAQAGAAVQARFAVSEAQVTADLHALIELLSARGLLRAQPRAPSVQQG